MQELLRGLMVVGIGLMAVVVFGLFRRDKWRECVAFTVYITLATTFSVLILLFPTHYTPETYTIKQGIYDSLLMVMAIELSVKVFAAFRGAADRVRTFLALAVIASTVIVFAVTPSSVSYADLFRYQPNISTAGIWSLAFVALLIVWYQIPIPAFTRAIILGYVPYQVVFVVFTDLIGRLGWGAIDGINLLNTVAYDAVAAYWAVVVWQKD